LEVLVLNGYMKNKSRPPISIVYRSNLFAAFFLKKKAAERKLDSIATRTKVSFLLTARGTAHLAVDLGLMLQKADRNYFGSLDRNTQESPSPHQRFFLLLAGDAVAKVIFWLH